MSSPQTLCLGFLFYLVSKIPFSGSFSIGLVHRFVFLSKVSAILLPKLVVGFELHLLQSTLHESLFLSA